MESRVLGLLVILLVLLGVGPMVAKAAPPTVTPTGAPRVNVATCYEVDPHWPQKPADVVWGQSPGVFVDGQDQVWVSMRAKVPVQVYDRTGKLVRSWGEGLFKGPHFLRIDPEGKVWLADASDHVIYQFTQEGKLLRTLGTKGQPGCDATHFNMPTDIAVTPAGDIFISDGYKNTRVVHFDKQGRFVKQWGKPGVGPGEFSLVHSIVADSQGRLYVADRDNARIEVFSPQGEFLAEWRSLLVPWGLWITKDDELWACGSSPMGWSDENTLLGCPPKDQLFMKFSTSGKVLQLWTIPKGEEGKEKPGELNWVHGIAVDSQGSIYATDIKGQRVQKFVQKK